MALANEEEEEDGSEEEEEEDSNEGSEEDSDEDDDSDEEEFDYGYVEEGDDNDYEVDITNTNVSASIMAILGYSAEEVAKVRAAQTGECADWKPPVAAGLDNSSVIAHRVSTPDLATVFEQQQQQTAPAVAAVPILASSPTSVATAAAAALPVALAPTVISGSDTPQSAAPAATVELPAGGRAPISFRIGSLQPVDLATDKLAAAALPLARAAAPVPAAGGPESDDSSDEGSDDSDDESDDDDDGQWDTASMGAWSDTGSDMEITNFAGMSPNLLRLLGHEDRAATAAAALSKLDTPAWVPPTTSGLGNSSAITTLSPVRVAAEQLQVKPMTGAVAAAAPTAGAPAAAATAAGAAARSAKGSAAEGSAEAEEDEESGDDEWDSENDSEFDYDEVDDDTYLNMWTTNVSANLLAAIGAGGTHVSAASSAQRYSVGGWQAPAASGLANSARIILPGAGAAAVAAAGGVDGAAGSAVTA